MKFNIETIFIILLFFGCYRFILKGHLNFIISKGIKLKDITNFKGKYVCTGGYKMKNDTVISKFEIESKYSLVAIKFKNVSNDFKLNYHSNSGCSTPGYFSVFSASEVYEMCLSPSVFKNDCRINVIDFISDYEINCQINNDTIKSFSLSFNEFVIKINNQVDKILKSDRIAYYGLKKLSANFLFYKIEDEIYLFIMTPLKGKDILENDSLYNYLFPVS
ncbi:hypothetical protein [Flavobacterium sp. AJR]|uniref:hypothetical protein n=1 Tax=Flavobacterium sp. AJR TaxID=1979369 RepID=UPI000A3D6602|nr:hypothetical protein [Flavobacterium sp. AJR]OUL60541.1 hypothetical protein B8T70_19710 [Flavobacterium sp. AJR]